MIPLMEFTVYNCITWAYFLMGFDQVNREVTEEGGSRVNPLFSEASGVNTLQHVISLSLLVLYSRVIRSHSCPEDKLKKQVTTIIGKYVK